MTPLSPWHRPLQRHPSDRARRAMWWQRVAFWVLAVGVVAVMWR